VTLNRPATSASVRPWEYESRRHGGASDGVLSVRAYFDELVARHLLVLAIPFGRVVQGQFVVAVPTPLPTLLLNARPIALG